MFLLYAATLARTTAFWDASEYIATANVLGVPHPPGNPLFVVLARTWTVLLEPLGLSAAVRVNLFSAFMSAAAHGVWFLVVHHVLGSFTRTRAIQLGGAAASVLISATAFTVWNQSNVNEKVYTVSLLTIALLSWLMLRWRASLAKSGDQRLLVLVAFVLALSVGNHLMAFLAAPAIVLFVLLVRPSTLLRWQLYPALAVAGLLGISIHLYLPIRAQLNPTINQGSPECAQLSDALVTVATLGSAGCEALSATLTRAQYKVEGEPGPGLTGIRQAPIASQYLNYLQYFDWQWARLVSGNDPLFPPGRLLFTALFAVLGILGARHHFARDPDSFWYMAGLFGTLSVGLVWYLNFEFGRTMPGAPDFFAREVRERDYFFIVSFSVWGLWAGMGLTAAWLKAVESGRSVLRTAPILALALIPLVLNFPWAKRSHDYAARDWAHNLLMSVEPYAMLFTSGDNDTFPLWYAQEVEGIRRDVQVIVGTYLQTGWYAKQIRDLTQPCPEGTDPLGDPTLIVCQRPYESRPDVRYGVGPPEVEGQLVLDTGSVVVPPLRSGLVLDDEAIDRIATSVMPIEETSVIDLGYFRTVVEGVTWLGPGEQFALSILGSSLGDRPVYFSSHASQTARTLGLSGRLVREGLAYRLSETDPDQRPELVPMPTETTIGNVSGPYVSRLRTELLLDQVYVHRNGLPDWDFWPDHSVNVPWFYTWAYAAASEAAVRQGDTGKSDEYADLAQRWSRLAS